MHRHFVFLFLLLTQETRAQTLQPPITQSPSGPKKIIKVGIIAAEVTNQADIEFATTGGAIPIAIEDIRKEHLLDDYNFEFYLNFTKCDEPSAVGAGVEQISEMGVDVIIGPPCTTAVIPVAMLGTYYKTLQVAWGHSTSYTLSDDKRFPYLNNISPNSLQLGYGLLSLLELYEWSEVALFYVDDQMEYCGTLMDDIDTAIQDPSSYQASIVSRVRLNISTRTLTDYTAALLRIKNRSRIVVTCFADNFSKRDFLIALAENKLTGPEFVYIMVGLKGFGFARGSSTSTTGDKISGDLTPMWVDITNNNADKKDAVAKEAARNLLVLDIDRIDGSVDGTDAATMRRDVFRKIREWPFFCKTPACLNNEDNVPTMPTFARQLHDSMLFYAYAMNKTLEGDPINGLQNRTQFMMARIAIKFRGWSGEIEMSRNGTRIPKFFLSGLNSAFQPIVYVNFTLESGSDQYMEATKLYTNEATSVWANRGGHRPLTVPLCGFLGNSCPKTTWEESGIFIIIGICVLLLMIVCFIGIMIYIWREKGKERERLNAEWRIPYYMLQRPNSKLDDRSMFSLQSSKSGKSSTSKFSMGSKKETSTNAFFYLRGEPMMAYKHKETVRLTDHDYHEFRMMRKMEHDNLNRFVGLSIDHSPLLSLWKFCSRGTLEEVLVRASINIDGFFMFSLIRDIAEGMDFIHRSFLKHHGKLSSTTCLIDERWQVKISGFGMSAIRFVEQPNKKQLLWKAPEQLRSPNDERLQEADVYSFAIVCSEILTRKTVFDLENRSERAEDLVYMIKKGGSVPMRPELTTADDLDMNPAVLHLIRDCWSEDVEARPPFATIRSLLKSMNGGRQQNLMDHVFNILETYAETLEKEVEDRMHELVEEKKKSDILLYRMLPRQVADKLKLGQSVEPESYESVTIFFSDVVKFTNLAARCTPLQIVNVLNDLYTTFDTIIEQHSVYKVETIGDGYLCVSGLPHRNGIQHVKDIGEMSLGFFQALGGFRIAHLPAERVNIRIGMHSGSCVAGVVGLTMPRYCLFGDTVNTASRMESNGKAGMIHCSATSNALFKQIGGYVTEPRGEVIIKGKGVMETFWLKGRKGEVEESTPFGDGNTAAWQEFTRNDTITAEPLPEPIMTPPGMYRTTFQA